MDRDILEQLYHQHFPKTYRTAYMVTGNAQLAEDAAQEAFLKAFINFHTLKETAKFGSWISVIATNCAIDILRKNKRIILTDNEEKYFNSNDENSPQESWEQQETYLEVRKALLLLEPEDREILVLKYFNELSIKEIAGMSSLPTGTIKSRLFRAREKVRRLLQPKGKKKRHINKATTR
ncbi:MAG TPA: RNA polymerase sigma factor [Firmicutes bacterium]|jgi:RNA polymerase sigma-70 factor (ECF subfamily)|nr:RNA polymerase sigma factor [Bacillota bacterium]